MKWLKRLGTIFVVNCIVLAFLVLGFGREYLRNREIERSIADVEQQNAQLEGKKLESLSVIESLSSEYYLEGEARRKHGMAKPGEDLTIVEDAQAATTTADDGAVADAVTGNPMRWWEYFFDRASFDAERPL